MIYTYKHLAGKDADLQCDVCVVGSGAGGAMVAAILAEAGVDTLLLEAGSLILPRDMNQQEAAMLSRLFWDKGGRATSDQAVKVHQGKGVGGSTLHNLCLCKRLPEAVTEQWRREHGAGAFVDGVLSLYPQVERWLALSDFTKLQLNENNWLFMEGCEKLGYRSGFLKHNRKDCIGSGFCELGCAFDSKQNALKVLIPRAVQGGARVLANCFASSIEHDGTSASRLIARVRDPRAGKLGARIRITAESFVLAASATGTPALMQRSGFPDPHGQIGAHLRLHPGVVAAGIFSDEVEGWKGIPQTWECTEFLRFEPGFRTWIIAAFAHPIGTAAEIPGFGAEHAALMRLYPYLGVLTAMIHDETEGRVSAKGESEVRIDYWPNAADLGQMRLGYREMSRILFAAGAEEVLIPRNPPLRLRSAEEISQLEKLAIEPHRQNITAVHPMGTARLGSDPKTSVVDVHGRHHFLGNVFVADTSLFPTSIGVPPQLTTYTAGLYVARWFLDG